MNIINNSINIIDKISKIFVAVSAFSVVMLMLDEVINAIGRKFGMPLPCALELAVSLMISSILLAVPYVASREEHTYVTMTTRMLPRWIQRAMDCFGFLIGVVVFGLLSIGAWSIAYHSVLKLEMQIGVFRFPIWPFRICFAFGLTLLSVQLLANAVRAVVQIKTGEYPDDMVDKYQ